jgi:hypothetical protein
LDGKNISDNDTPRGADGLDVSGKDYFTEPEKAGKSYSTNPQNTDPHVIP